MTAAVYNAVFRIDQVQGRSTSMGSPGVSRKDIWVNTPVLLTPVSAPDAPSTTFKWEFLDKPTGSAAVFLSSSNGLPNDAAKNVMFVPDVWGTYRVQLTINKGQYTERRLIAPMYSETGLLIRRGWRLPAYRESGEEANFPGQTRGYAEDLDAALTDLCMHGFAVKHTYSLVGGLVSAAQATPKLVGGVRYDPATDMAVPTGVARNVKFQALLETTDASKPAYIQLYDRSGITGSVGLITSSLLGPCTSLVSMLYEVDLTSVLGSNNTPGILECWLWTGSTGALVSCTSARLLLSST